MILPSWMLWRRSLLSKNIRNLIPLTRTLTLTIAGSQISQSSKQHRIGTGQLHPHIISLQAKVKAKVQEFRNLPATGIEAKMTGSSMTVATTSHAPVRAHFFQKTRAAIVGKQDIGVMSVPPLVQVGALFLPLNGERETSRQPCESRGQCHVSKPRCCNFLGDAMAIISHCSLRIGTGR